MSLGATKFQVDVADKVHDPSNPKRFHYRFQGRHVAVDDQAAHGHSTKTEGDGKKSTPTYVNVDFEATLRDSTVDLGDVGVCERGSDGFVSFKVAGDGAASAEYSAAKVFIGSCSNLGGDIIYGRVADIVDADASGEVQVVVDSNFASEFDKMHAAFLEFTMQSYAGPTHIEHSSGLQYLKELGEDPAEFFHILNARYGRTGLIDRATASAGSALRGRRLACEGIDGVSGSADCDSTGSVGLYNCDTVSTDPDNRGCSSFTDASLTLLSNEVISYGGADFTIDLSCEECAVTMEGASLYSKISSDFSIDVDWDGVSVTAEVDYSYGAQLDGTIDLWRASKRNVATIYCTISDFLGVPCDACLRRFGSRLCSSTRRWN